MPPRWSISHASHSKAKQAPPVLYWLANAIFGLHFTETRRNKAIISSAKAFIKNH